MRLPLAARLSLSLFLFISLPGAHAAEPFFKKGDVVALVGGEDMVVASEYGYLELLLIRALPDYHLRFRNLAWEGDTVFEQRRDLNFPTWEEQLDNIGATVVIVQFGQMESLAGKEKLPEFIAAYEKLIERMSAGGKRKVVIIGPAELELGGRHLNVAYSDLSRLMEAHERTVFAVENLAERLGISWVPASDTTGPKMKRPMTRDGVHSTPDAHQWVAYLIYSLARPVAALAVDAHKLEYLTKIESMTGADMDSSPLRQLIVAKNRLWFDYWRPQNWAFLAGDRISQPSSRDHLDPSKRWFPPEREEFLPLIEAKEKEIDTLAAQLAKP